MDWNIRAPPPVPEPSVVPYIGTWIETFSLAIFNTAYRRTLYRYVDWNCSKQDDTRIEWCRTLYRYVDWNILLVKWRNLQIRRTLYRYVDWNASLCPFTPNNRVVPYIGTWIETIRIKPEFGLRFVVPYIGTWIETLGLIRDKTFISRTLYRYVDWNLINKTQLAGLTKSYLI